MSKITVITASPRKDGNSNYMAKWFAEEAERLGADVKIFDAVKLQLDGCHACNTCYKTGHACTFEHGFDPIAESVLASDTIVFVVPVYYFAMPGQVKNVLDHFYSFIVSGKELGKKTILALGTSGQGVETDVFEGVRVILKKTAEYNSWAYEELSYGNMNEPGAITRTDAEQKVKVLAQRFA